MIILCFIVLERILIYLTDMEKEDTNLVSSFFHCINKFLAGQGGRPSPPAPPGLPPSSCTGCTAAAFSWSKYLKTSKAKHRIIRYLDFGLVLLWKARGFMDNLHCAVDRICKNEKKFLHILPTAP